jgi:hypothetical protein
VEVAAGIEMIGGREQRAGGVVDRLIGIARLAVDRAAGGDAGVVAHEFLRRAGAVVEIRQRRERFACIALYCEAIATPEEL